MTPRDTPNPSTAPTPSQARRRLDMRLLSRVLVAGVVLVLLAAIAFFSLTQGRATPARHSSSQVVALAQRAFQPGALLGGG